MNKKILTDGLGLLLIVLLILVGYQYSSLLLPKSTTTLLPPESCQLDQAICAVPLPGGGRLDIDLGPRPIPVLKPLTLSLSTQGARITSAEADFAGKDMNMGYLRPALQADSTGKWQVETALPVCITGEMLWQLTLLLEIDGKSLSIPLQFTTRKEN